MTKIAKTTALPKEGNIVLLGTAKTAWQKYGLTAQEVEYVKKRFADPERKSVAINRMGTYVFVQQIDKRTQQYQTIEECRRAGSTILASLNANDVKEVTIYDIEGKGHESLAVA